MVVTGGTWGHFCRSLISYIKKVYKRYKKKTKNSFLLKLASENYRVCKLEIEQEVTGRGKIEKIVLSEFENKKIARLRNRDLSLQVFQELSRKQMCAGGYLLVCQRKQA